MTPVPAAPLPTNGFDSLRRSLLSLPPTTPSTPTFYPEDSPSTADEFEPAPLVPAGGQLGTIKAIRFGEFLIQTWYQAPFPEEYSRIFEGTLWICEFCLKYMKGGFQAGRHRLKCKVRHPPGDEIYRDGKVSVFEVDGRKNKVRPACPIRVADAGSLDLLPESVSARQNVPRP